MFAPKPTNSMHAPKNKIRFSMNIIQIQPQGKLLGVKKKER